MNQLNAEFYFRQFHDFVKLRMLAMNQGIKELREGLPVRTVNVLVLAGIDTKEKLALARRNDLLKIVKFGAKSLLLVDIFLGRTGTRSNEIFAAIKLLRENGYRIERI